MPNTIPTHTTVKHTPLKGKTVPDCLSILDNVCSAAAQCQEVQGSTIGKQALADLQKTLTTAHGSLSTKQSLASALLAAVKTLKIDFGALQTSLLTYEAVVRTIADGDGSVINKAGLLSRALKPVPAALGQVTVVQSKPGKHETEAILRWPRAPGATGYALEVNFTPQTPAGPWTPLASGTSRRRVVKGPAPAAQFLVRVAAVGSDGTQSEWSTPILATAL